MIDRAQALRFIEMETTAPRLTAAFRSLTAAHLVFQAPGPHSLRSISVSDQCDNGSIEAAFQGVRVKFAMLPIFGADRRPRARVLCMNCHCTYGEPVQERLGSFTFGTDGQTDLDPDIEGNFPRMDADAPAIVLRFLEAAIAANKLI